MAEQSGRLVTVTSRFAREAIRPGGVDRSSAVLAAEKSVADLQGEVISQVESNVRRLIAILQNWDGSKAEHAVEGCKSASMVRDLAGVIDMALLTEVAMHSFDCLDLVAVDGVSLRPEEAACYADALVFARREVCRGQNLQTYAPLLADLKTLTSRVAARANPGSQ